MAKSVNSEDDFEVMSATSAGELRRTAANDKATEVEIDMAKEEEHTDTNTALLERITQLETRLAEMDEKYSHTISSAAVAAMDSKRATQINHDFDIRSVEQKINFVFETLSSEVQALNNHVTKNTIAGRKMGALMELQSSELASIVAGVRAEMENDINRCIVGIVDKFEAKIEHIQRAQAGVDQVSASFASVSAAEETASAMQHLNLEIAAVEHKVGRVAHSARNSETLLQGIAQQHKVLQREVLGLERKLDAGLSYLQSEVDRKASNEGIDECFEDLLPRMVRLELHNQDMQAKVALSKVQMDSGLLQIKQVQKMASNARDAKTNISKLARKVAEHEIIMRNNGAMLESEEEIVRNRENLEKLSDLMADYCEINVARITNLDRRLAREEELRAQQSRTDNVLVAGIAKRFSDIEANLKANSIVEQPNVSVATRATRSTRLCRNEMTIFGYIHN